MKTVMISIHTKWVPKIISGEKTVEVRKFDLPTPFRVVMYETLGKKHKYNGKYCLTQNCNDCNGKGCYEGRGKVVLEFVVKTAERYEIYETGIETNRLTSFDEIEVAIKNSCLNIQELRVYAKDKPIYAWHISDLKVYDNPKELNNFYVRKKRSYYALPYDISTYAVIDTKEPLTRPPQNFVYVEVE